MFNVIWLLFVGSGATPRNAHTPSTHASAGAIALAILGIAVVAPIVEEITFRGYLFPALTRWRGPWIGALVCGTIFGLAHWAVYPPQLLPLMAVFGFGACLLYWFTGSLLPGIALHAMNNALVTGIALGWDWQVPLLMLGCMAFALLLLAPVRPRAGSPARLTTGGPRLMSTASPLDRHSSPVATSARKDGRATGSMIVGIL